MNEGKQETAEPYAEEPLVLVARAVKTRGLKGEIVADLLTDFPERFERTLRLFAVAPDGVRRVVDLELHWFLKGRIVLKIAGYDNVEAARTLIGYDFAVPESERVELPADHFYNWELEGCRVETVEGQMLGQVRRVLRTGGVELLVIENDQKREYLVPMVESIVRRIDVPQKLIVVDPPEGLLEL